MSTHDSNVKIHLTLPLSCHICLDRVKEPVICANHHVFCSQCIGVWLKYNTCCPTCRTAISPDSPCKPILGTSEETTSYKDDTIAKDLRKARVEMILTEYEDELSRLHDLLKIARRENVQLKSTIQLCDSHESCTCKHKDDHELVAEPARKIAKLNANSDDSDALYSITNELMSASKNCFDLVQDMEKVHETNIKLREENESLKAENDRLRCERVSTTTSPYRHGRYVMAAMQSKIGNYEKEIEQLKKALVRSDNYIEELISRKQDQPHEHKESFSKGDQMSAIDDDGETCSSISRDFGKRAIRCLFSEESL